MFDKISLKTIFFYSSFIMRHQAKDNESKFAANSKYLRYQTLCSFIIEPNTQSNHSRVWDTFS